MTSSSTILRDEYSPQYTQQISWSSPTQIKADISRIEEFAAIDPERAGYVGREMINGILLRTCRFILSSASATNRTELAKRLHIPESSLDELALIPLYEHFLSQQMKRSEGVDDYQDWIEKNDFSSLIIFMLDAGPRARLPFLKLYGQPEEEAKSSSSHKNEHSESVNGRSGTGKAAVSNYYSLLGVPQDASPTEIREAYRTLANIHHPDRGGSAKFMSMLNQAYGVLSKPDERQAYDLELEEAQNKTARPSAAPAQNQSTEQQHRSTSTVDDAVGISLALIAAARKRAIRMVLTGACWFFGGSIVTGLAYSSAPEGGNYFVFYGPILYGLYELARGLYYLASPDSLIRKSIPR
jgi:DnaJ-domain-containing protein 1